MGRANGGARLLADVLEKILNHGAGPMNIPYDDLRVALHKAYGLGLDETRTFVSRHIATALDILAEDDWSSVKTTEEWIAFGYVEPVTEVELKHCIAGLGRLSDGSPSTAVGLHFCIGKDDMLFVYARDHGARVWRGKRHKEMGSLKVAADAGRLTPTGMMVAEASAIDPTVGDKTWRRERKQLPG